MKYTVKKLTYSAIFIALSVVGGQIKVLDTIAFDSMPAFLAGIVLGPVYGGVVGLIGHLVNALTSGFPFGILIHIIIAGCMFIAVAAFAYSYQVLSKRFKGLGKVVAAIIATVINGPLTLVLLTPLLGKELCLALVAPLSIVAAINVVLAIVVYNLLSKSKVTY